MPLRSPGSRARQSSVWLTRRYGFKVLPREMDAAKSEIARLRNSEAELQARSTRAELSVSEAQALAAKEQARSTSLERELAERPGRD